MIQSISASVGKNGTNKPSDVKIVQELLNRVPKVSGGPLASLEVDGLCWNFTLAAIGNFQKIACGFQWPDQLIAVGGKTWNQLLVLAQGATDIDPTDGEGDSPPLSTFQFIGVDSVIPANDTTYTYGKKTFYDAVSNKLKVPIRFWGRYINKSQSLDGQEVAYLHGKDCKVLVIYNGTSSASVAATGPNAANVDVLNATSAALGIPQNVIVYANIDSGKNRLTGNSFFMNPSVDWLVGWMKGMYTSRKSAGLYMGHDISTNYRQAYSKVAKEIQEKTSLMLAPAVVVPSGHLGAFHIKQDVMGYKIFHIKSGDYARVDVDSANAIGLSHMW